MSGCPQGTKESPSREFNATVYARLEAAGTTVAEIDPDRRSILIVSTVATGGVDIKVVSESGAGTSSDKVWPLAPGEGVTLSTAAKVVVRAGTGGAGSCKVLIERGSV